MPIASQQIVLTSSINRFWSELAFGTFWKLIRAYEAGEVELIVFRLRGKQQLSLNLGEHPSQMRCELVSRLRMMQAC